MEKYTANYANTNPNFVIQNIKGENRVRDKYYPMLCVLKNIIQRGYPTTMSEFLQKSIGSIHMEKNFNKKMGFIDRNIPQWSRTIKGDAEEQYYPAKEFFEDMIPKYLPEYQFIQQLMLPEVAFEDIVEDSGEYFHGQQVDFYLPQAKLVIEIDGQRHKIEDVTRINDKERAMFLQKHMIDTVRLTTSEINEASFKNEQFMKKIKLIEARLKQYSSILNFYKSHYEHPPYFINDYNEKLMKSSAIIRFQVLVISLLQKKRIKLDDNDWRLNILARDVEHFAELAIEDLFIWIKNLCKLNKLPYYKPNIQITYCKDAKDYIFENNVINIDFSLLRRWTDENIDYENVIFVRSDYNDKKNYFEVSISDPIKYKIIYDGEESDIPVLKFLLKNIFGFDDFNDGQIPIIVNTLALNDTIGILPTGGGKSLTYQFTALLQPCISFVVCPIKSLMYDQKYNTFKKYITYNDYISSDQDASEKNQVSKNFANGKYFFIWMSPERFQTPKFRKYLEKLNKEKTIAYAVIDEVHCLSEWGHDFRTSYLNLIKTIRKYCPSSTLLGLTATASSFVLEDLKVEFNLSADNIKTLTSFTRPELNFHVIKDDSESLDDKEKELIQLLKRLDEKDNIFTLDNENSKSGLIFTMLKNGSMGCYDLSLRISGEFNINAEWYSGEIPKKTVSTNGRRVKISVMPQDKFDEYKLKVQNDFQENKYPLLVATKAFGMGIDKSNIRYTIHFGIPGSLESLYQEAGRAGRDKKEANCYILYSREKLTPDEFEILFNPDTSIEEISKIQEKYGFKNSRDILRNFFFWLNSNKGIAYEFKVMKKIYDSFAKKGTTQLIECKKLEYSFSEIQKAIYKLSLLGIIEDWTIENWNKGSQIIKIKLNKYTKKTIMDSLLKYIKRYDKEFNLDITNEQDIKYSKYIKILRDKSLKEYEKAILILLEWGYDNIVYNRRQSIKNILELCDGYSDPSTFKEGIEKFFRFSEKSYLLDHIAQNPTDIESWFRIFYENGENIEEELEENKVILEKNKLQEIQGSLSRLLESYRYNTGLNYISGIVRFLLDEFDNQDGKYRLESALGQIDKYKKDEKQKILKRTLKIGKIAKKENKEDLSELLCEYYPNNIIDIYESLEDNFSLLKVIKNSKERIQKIGGAL
ncbi:DEAD/DEAH box helicase [Senegalia massiliensis]|uniref:DNA 3'-5' helicase n=1 Tax=Senegalia massiliensis TaxID=1720316 RepID=A0A845QX68_9CLOT|nr:DEAD/DEAH box helicase [Senegalia massiliensis]NBI06106.1 DEAD/DEAH box helicase [Senegalia massiliensis]